MSAIPAKARAVVRERDGGHCLRCGGGRGIEVHHRRRRGTGPNPHGYENLASLCGVCHAWVHAHPAIARQDGFIVPSHVDEVADVRLNSYMGIVILEPDGGFRWH